MSLQSEQAKKLKENYKEIFDLKADVETYKAHIVTMAEVVHLQKVLIKKLERPVKWFQVWK